MNKSFQSPRPDSKQPFVLTKDKFAKIAQVIRENSGKQYSQENLTWVMELFNLVPDLESITKKARPHVTCMRK